MADPNPQSAHVTSVMEDPSSQAVARTYADALLDAAGTGTDAALEDLGSFVEDVLDKLPQLREVFFSRVIGREEKIRLIDEAIAP
ncbi:MAG TPA: F0F1 ATP synthase subunit delta, partial [Planctomycetaceae bacterium]|nr:F0F1 ATP synthase subunit delta [Planctomycetaceae bacterium]